MGWDLSLSFSAYGSIFQKHRRLFQQSFSQQKVIQYRRLQLREAHRLAINLLENAPDRMETLLSLFSTSIIISITYGHEILSDDDPYVQLAAENRYVITHCGTPGGTPVDLFPILQYLPSWFPGTFFAWKARESSHIARQMQTEPFDTVRRQMTEGTAKPSFVSYHLERLHQESKETSEELNDIKMAAATVYAAGADTTWSSMSTFMLAMTLYPEWQLRAQQEIDAHLCGSRLPEIEDRDGLPLVDCILQETYRWLNAIPLGIPHRALQDDVYKGMFIPKGSLVIANARGISMNETVYHDPSSFNPSRYLSKSKGGREEPWPSAHFGFGRRICPGRHLADVSLWLAVTTILSLFDIKKMRDEDGQEITPEVGMDSGLSSHPKPYKCFVQLRNDKANELMGQIRNELMDE